MKRPTIVDIARRAGVSKSAASYALNGRPGVSAQVRQRVLDAAAELGWERNQAARALSAARAEAVGLVLARPARTLAIEPFFMQLIAGIETELATRSIALVLQVTPDIDGELAAHRQWWGRRSVDGVFVVDLRRDDPRVALLAELGMPAVALGGLGHHGGLACVWSDEPRAIGTVVDYLVTLGHVRIGRVAGRPDFLHTSNRDAAFVAAAERRGGVVPSIVHTDYSGEQGAKATRGLLSQHARPTAIVFDSDVMAVAGVNVAAEMGLRVPADLSVVAWDDSPLCRLMHPALTAVSFDTFLAGTQAARRLCLLIDGGTPGGLELPVGELIPRGSTAPPQGRLGPE
jgi:DNA-binding LacI/PurR family transcriptional regulator